MSVFWSACCLLWSSKNSALSFLLSRRAASSNFSLWTGLPRQSITDFDSFSNDVSIRWERWSNFFIPFLDRMVGLFVRFDRTRKGSCVYGIVCFVGNCGGVPHARRKLKAAKQKRWC
jgi:hypothetical protein